MPMKWIPLIVLALGVGFTGYGLRQRQLHPPRVIATGTFKFADKSGAELIFPKRTVAVAGFETIELQLPGGTWIDCRGDCTGTIKSEHTEFWDTQSRRR